VKRSLPTFAVFASKKDFNVFFFLFMSFVYCSQIKATVEVERRRISCRRGGWWRQVAS
jgi:hypothetical protein